MTNEEDDDVEAGRAHAQGVAGIPGPPPDTLRRTLEGTTSAILPNLHSSGDVITLNRIAGLSTGLCHR